MAETVDPALVDWSGVEDPPQPALPTVPSSEVDWSGLDAATAPASAASGLPTVSAADVDWSAIDAGPAQDEFTLPPGGELLGTYPPGDYENVQTGERFSVANTIQNVDMSGVEEAPAPEGISPNLGLQLPVKSIDLGEGREAVVPTNVQSGINWVSDIKPEKVERTQVRPGVYRSGGEYEIGDASLKMSKLSALERLSEQVFSEDMFPEAQMGVGIPTIINSMKKAELLRPDPDDAEKYWLELTEEDGSAGEPKLVTKGEAEAIARGILSKQMQEDRDRTRKTLSRARDPQQKAEALYSFLYTYYPEAAKVAVRDNPLFTSVDFEEGPPWYANIAGVINVLDIALPPLAVTRKVGLEVKNTVIKERLIEGQSDDWDFETNKTVPFDENMKGLVNDYLATNNGYRMENGNYLLPKWFGPMGSSAPSVWPEGLEPDIKPGAPFSAAGGFNPARAALADNEYNRNIVEDIESRIEAGELRWKKPGLGRPGELEVVSGESVSDNAQDIYREVKTGDWSQSVLEKSYVAQTGLPGTTVIEGQEFSVLSPRQFRALLLEDLEQHVSLSGKLKAPLRWAGLQRGFSEINPAEEWRRLGLRRFIGGSRGTPGEVHLTGDHFPGYTATKKVGEFGVPTDAKFVEDLAKAVSAVGGPGRAISDDVAYESGKDIAALIALPGRGLQDLWRVADEQVLDLMEMGAPETWRRDPSEDPGYVGIPGILGVPEIDSRSAQNLAEILSDPGEEASTGFKYDPEAGIDPLGNLTLELATLFAADPYGMKAAGRMLGGGARGAQAAAKPSMVHSRVGLLTKEGGDALDAMTVTRIQEAADKLGVGMAELPSYARHQAMRQATNDFARAHSEARSSGKAIEDISYQTDIVTGADGSEKLVVRDLFVGSPEGAPFIRPDINVQATDDLGVELIGGIFPRQTAKRTQFQYGQAYRRQVSSILDGIRAQGGARARAVDAAAKVFEAAPNVALKPLRWLDRVVGTDWVKVGGATPKEAWGIVRSSLEDLGYSASEISDFSNKTLNRLQGELAEKYPLQRGADDLTFYPDFNLANYTPEDLVLAARLQEVNADIILDERLMTEVVAPLREFLDGARAFEDEFLRMDGTFRLFLQDPRGRQAIEELRLAQWKQKYREIAAQHPPGSDERVTAVRDSMIALQNDYEAIQYTLGRMERSGEVRALEDAMVESLEHAELLEARALDIEGKIPRRSARRVRTPKSLTPQETVDEFVNTAISARDEIADLRAEIERLRLDLVDEVPKEQRAAARLQDKEIKKALKKVGKRKIDSLKKELEKLEARYAEFQRAYEDSVDMPAFFFPERRGLDEALTTRASWGKDTSISIPGTSETIRGERAGDFVVHKNYTVTDAGTVVPKKDYALSYAPRVSGPVSGVPASALESDDALTLWIRENPSSVPAIQSEINLANKEALEPFDEMVEVFHGAPKKAAGAIKEKGFALKEGLRGGFFGGDKKVKNQAIFLTEDKAAARSFGSNKADFPADVEVLSVRADVRNTLDMSDWLEVPKSIRDDAMSRLRKYDGSELTEPRAEDFFWFLDQPEIVNKIKSHGFDSVRFFEDASTTKALGVDGPVSTLAVFDPKKLHMPKEPYRGLSGARDFIRSRQAGTLASSLERVAHGFKNPRDAKSFGDVATGVIGAAEKESGGYALNLLHEMGVAGKVIYRDKKVFKPWEIQAGLGIGDAAEWTAKAQRAVRDQRQLSKMRESIETKRKQLGAIEADLGAKIKKPSKWRDDIQSNRAVRREIAARERTVRQLERMASSADRGAGQATKAIAQEKVAIQRVARSELRKKMAGEVRQLRGSARQSRWEHARRRNELRDVLDDIKAEARETAAALAVPRAIQEFNRAAEVAVNAKSSFAPGAAEKVIEDILLPYGTASRSWRYQGIKKKLTDKQLRLPEADRLTALNAQKGKQVKGFVQARSYAEAEKKLRDKGVAVIEELEAGARSKLQGEIDDLQREIGEMLNPATKGAGQLEASTPMDLMQMLGLTEDATPFQIVERVLKNQDEALKVDIQLARAVPGYDKKMDKLLSTLESLTESERFLVSDFLKFESAPGKAPRGGRYAGLTAEQAHLRPVIELFRGYYSEMLNLLKDQGMFRDWSLYEFLDRTNVGSYIHHTLAEAGFGLTGKAAQTARKAAAQGRLLPSEAGLTRYRGIPGAIHEINDAMRWQVAESIVKNQIKLGMHGPDAAKALAARGPVPQELVESVVREVPADLRYFQENPLLIASNYSINVGKVIGNRRFWDDMAFVVDTYFPEASKLSRLISDPKLVMKEAEASYQARRTEAIRRGDPVPERGAEVTYEVGLRELDRQAALMADKINPMTGKKYGEKFVRLGGADYLSLVTNGKFPSGDKAVLDAIDLMVTQGVDAQKVQEELLTRFGLELTVPEVQGFYRGQTYLPESLANFVKAQLGHSPLAIGIKGLPSDLKVPAQLALDVLDNINEIFKGLVTVVWPRFHGRNAWSGLIANAMVHGEIAVRPEFQKKVIMVLSKEGHEIPFTFGGITKTGLEWQDVLRRLRVSPDRGAVADLEGIAAGAPGALLGPTELERMQAAASRVVQNVKSGEGRLTEWDNLIEFLYDRAHFKDTRAAFHAEKPAIMSGRLRTGPFGKALTGTGLGALSGFSAGMAGGGPLVAVPSGLVGAAIGYMSTLPARNLVTLGGEIGRGTEMQLRSSNFFAGLEKGHSLDEAAHLATMTHFNYRPHGQSWFSYNVMRRAMPFWTWNSKNFKKQLWLMRHRPQEYAALQHILTAVTHHEKSPELEATLPKNFASRVAFLTREGAYHGFGTPFEAFVESVRPSTEGGMIGTAGAGGLAHPGFQWLYEEVQGRSMYFDKDLTEIRGARDLEYTFPFLQEYFGAGPDSRGVWKIGQLDPLAEENRGKPWIPTQEEAPIRWNRAKKLNAFAGILSLWQQLRAESYQDAYGELDPAGMKVSFPERAARLGLSWRKYSYDPDIERARIKAWSRFSRELTKAYGEADREGTLDLPLILKEEGSDRFMNEESRLLLEQLGLGAEARP